jgi:hypothetical protein
MPVTSRERLLAAIRFQDVDRIPVAPFTIGALQPGSSVLEEMIEKTDPFIEGPVPGDVIFGENCRRTVTEEDDATVTTYETPLGSLVQKIRVRQHAVCVEFPIKTPEDAERFLSIDYVPPKVDMSNFLKTRDWVGDQGLTLLPIADAVLIPAVLLSPEDFCLWWADYPDLLKRITAVASRRLNDFVRELCEAGADAFRIVGGEYASVQLGPSGFDALVLEQDRELTDIMRSYGAVSYYHNHGPVMNYMSRFREIGMDALDPLEAPPWGDADLRAAREICGDKVAFVGNMDDMEIVDKLSREEVERIALERVEAAGDRGFILGGTASGTFTEHAVRNFIALAELMERRAHRS